MVPEALAALAAGGGTALMEAVATDGWQAVKTGFARLLGRGDERLAAAVEGRLERSRAELAALSGAELARARAAQEAAWRARLEDLLEEHPQAADQLADLLDRNPAPADPVTGGVRQRVLGFGAAQQAMQGHGVQTNIFGVGRHHHG
jgi:hypothetical protein